MQVNYPFDSSLSGYRIVSAQLDVLGETLIGIAQSDNPEMTKLLEETRAAAEKACLNWLDWTFVDDIARADIIATGSAALIKTLPKPDSRPSAGLPDYDGIFIEAAGPEYINTVLDYFSIEDGIMEGILSVCYKDARWLDVLDKIGTMPMVLDLVDTLPDYAFAGSQQSIQLSMQRYPEVMAPLLARQIAADPMVGAGLIHRSLVLAPTNEEDWIDAMRILRACGAEIDPTDERFAKYADRLSKHQRIRLYSACPKVAAHAARPWADIAEAIAQKRSA